jgi:signal transduction histidine kinase
MPKGHLPVRSYLAVPVASRSGEVLGGLFFGHSRPGVFLPEHETLLAGIAGQAATAIDNARLFQAVERELAERRRAEEALQALNATLADRIAEEMAKRDRAEGALRQAQKMEAVGQLTGGIAHDFNNMLAVIIGGLNLLQRKLAKGETDVDRFIEGAMDGAQRAAALTQRLLAFSRQQPLAPEPINANRMVSGMTELLSRTLGETIRVETVLGAGLWQVKADPGQLESAMLNLAVNARDAMPEGGNLTIETSNAFVDEDYAREFAIQPGQYVLIAVTDTGTGMPPEVMAKAFDPFFTTKSAGKGTGLGLSQVYGFVRQSGGHVKIYSEVGVGTTAKIYLPRFYGEADHQASARQGSVIDGGLASEVVLVVEDEERVRGFSVEALRDLGYTVMEARTPREALDLIEGGAKILLLFTDVVMPEMSGRQLAEQALKLQPGLKVLYTTGYTRNAIVHNGMLDPGTQLISKPFTVNQLAAKVRSVLDG